MVEHKDAAGELTAVRDRQLLNRDSIFQRPCDPGAEFQCFRISGFQPVRVDFA